MSQLFTTTGRLLRRDWSILTPAYGCAWLTFGASKEVVGPDLFRLLAKQSAERRNGLFGPETNAFRLINGESDGFPGLVADKYADVLVMKVYTAAFIPHLGDVAGCFI